jgi:hypothetical protein
MDNTNKLTAPQAALLKRFPEIFCVFEDFRRSNNPGTIILDIDGNEVFRFTTGNAAAFKSLIALGRLIRMGQNENGGNSWVNKIPYGKV